MMTEEGFMKGLVWLIALLGCGGIALSIFLSPWFSLLGLPLVASVIFILLKW